MHSVTQFSPNCPLFSPILTWYLEPNRGIMKIVLSLVDPSTRRTFSDDLFHFYSVSLATFPTFAVSFPACFLTTTLCSHSCFGKELYGRIFFQRAFLPQPFACHSFSGEELFGHLSYHHPFPVFFGHCLPLAAHFLAKNFLAAYPIGV